MYIYIYIHNKVTMLRVLSHLGPDILRTLDDRFEFKFISSARGQRSLSIGLISISLIVSLSTPCPSLVNSDNLDWLSACFSSSRSSLFWIGFGLSPKTESEDTCPVFLGVFLQETSKEFVS